MDPPFSIRCVEVPDEEASVGPIYIELVPQHMQGFHTGFSAGGGGGGGGTLSFLPQKLGGGIPVSHPPV